MLGFGSQRARERVAREALAALYDQFGPALHAYAAGLLSSREDAEEVVQEVFARYFGLLLARRPAAQPEHFLFRCTRNLAYSRLRRRKLLGLFLKQNQTAPGWLAPVNGASAALRAEVEGLLASLPAKQREVIVLKVYQERTFDEIGALLSISPNTAASRYRYAIEKLRAALEEHSHEI